MTSREIRERGPKKSKRALAFKDPLASDLDNQVLTFQEWCRLNRISERAGRRIIHSVGGPAFVKLTPRRYGITVAANREWQASRTRVVA
jgi:hypothetical protein